MAESYTYSIGLADLSPCELKIKKVTNGFIVNDDHVFESIDRLLKFIKDTLGEKK